jgi:hypothetical protein
MPVVGLSSWPGSVSVDAQNRRKAALCAAKGAMAVDGFGPGALYVPVG